MPKRVAKVADLTPAQRRVVLALIAQPNCPGCGWPSPDHALDCPTSIAK